MSDSNSRLTFLFHRYYSGSATDAEIAELMEMINVSGDDSHITQLMKDSWDRLQDDEKQFSQKESDVLFASIIGSNDDEKVRFNQRTERRRYLGWMRYAAAVVILLAGAGGYWKFRANRDTSKIIADRPAIQDIPAGGNKALLTLSDGSTIVLDSAGNGLVARQGPAEIRKTGSGQLVYGLAAQNNDLSGSKINTISTPKGGTYQIVLPDGSRAWLNAASSISFPAVFAKSERNVKIVGEVYFEVEKNKAKPFKVTFGDTEVEVFGTSFNIMAYGDETASYTTLVEGSIALTKGKISKQLRPGEQAAVLKNGKLLTEEVDVNEATAWKNGLFFFKDAAVETVMKQVSRWYDVEISYEGNIPVRQLTGKVSRNVNISELMEMLNYAGMKCRIEGRKVVVSP